MDTSRSREIRKRVDEKRYSHDGVVIVDHLKEDLIYIDGKDELLELAEYVDRLQEENRNLKSFIEQKQWTGDVE